MSTITETSAAAQEAAAHETAAELEADPTLRERLLEKGILIDTGENGLYGRSAVFEDIVDRLNVAISHLGADQQPELLRFPPAMRRTDFEDSEYLKNFPQLAGTIHSFCGDDMGHRRLLRALDDAMAERDDDRDDAWLGQQLVRALSLPLDVDLANDPFFGRGGKIVADSQRTLALKFELLIPVANPESKTACLSFNYHMDHFGGIWKIACADGSVAHTGCVGFGMERITLALFRHHGLDVNTWPDAVRALLWGDTRARIAQALEGHA